MGALTELVVGDGEAAGVGDRLDLPKTWANAKGAVLTALSLPESPDELLAGHARTLDDAYREVNGRLAEDSAISVDEDGRLHVERTT